MPEHNQPGSIYSTPEWRRLRAACFERDGNRCRRCGQRGTRLGGTRVLTAAHILPERIRRTLGRPLSLSDLITLCRQCHGHLDGGRRYPKGSPTP